MSPASTAWADWRYLLSSVRLSVICKRRQVNAPTSDPSIFRQSRQASLRASANAIDLSDNNLRVPSDCFSADSFYSSSLRCGQQHHLHITAGLRSRAAVLSGISVPGRARYPERIAWRVFRISKWSLVQVCLTSVDTHHRRKGLRGKQLSTTRWTHSTIKGSFKDV